MSDTTNRDIPAPPVRRAGGASALIKDNRVPVAPADVQPDSSRTISGPPPAPRPAAPQTIESDPELDEAVRVLTATTLPTPDATAQAISENAVKAPAPTAPVSFAETPAGDEEIRSTPYLRRKGLAPAGESPDDIIKVTFEVRRGDRDAFNAAFAAASFNEGFATPKELLQLIYTRETKRIEDAYNGGEPFPRRNRQAPRGRPIRADQ